MVKGMRDVKTMRNIWNEKKGLPTRRPTIGLDRIGTIPRTRVFEKEKILPPKRTWAFTTKPQFARYDKTLLVEKVAEPMVDIFKKANDLVVIAQLPGTKEEDISFEIKDDILDITAKAKGPLGNIKYYKEFLLPFAVDAQNVESSYKNEILEIRLVRKPPKKEE